MSDAYEILKERGYIKQMTHEKEIIGLLKKEKVCFYIGFDPTADSLHVGHFIQLMAMSHMQKAGHKPIALIGVGTAMVGDPSGRTDMRKMLSLEQIHANSEVFKQQISKFINFSKGKALMVDNSEWLLGLKYIPFLREVGVHYSVNRMLAAECFKTRLEKGLSFIEFNYMLMQGYDFLELFRKYDCKLQLGGDDQWSNILGGVELIRRSEGKDAFGMTFTLLTTSEGKKMGKTEKGALWMDSVKTSPYDFYQYWRNVDDGDVKKCLALLTFLPMKEVNELGELKDSQINEAKKALAYEVTKIIHSKEEAGKARSAAEAIFEKSLPSDDMPSFKVEKEKISEGIKITVLMTESGITLSNGEAKRAISQGGVKLNKKEVEDFSYIITDKDFADGYTVIQKGKKSFIRIVFK